MQEAVGQMQEAVGQTRRMRASLDGSARDAIARIGRDAGRSPLDGEAGERSPLPGHFVNAEVV
jgi:hypothetical protein